MDRGAWRATVHSIAESDMTEHTHCSNYWLFIDYINWYCPEFYLATVHRYHPLSALDPQFTHQSPSCQERSYSPEFLQGWQEPPAPTFPLCQWATPFLPALAMGQVDGVQRDGWCQKTEELGAGGATSFASLVLGVIYFLSRKAFPKWKHTFVSLSEEPFTLPGKRLLRAEGPGRAPLCQFLVSQKETNHADSLITAS